MTTGKVANNCQERGIELISVQPQVENLIPAVGAVEPVTPAVQLRHIGDGHVLLPLRLMVRPLPMLSAFWHVASYTCFLKIHVWDAHAHLPSTSISQQQQILAAVIYASTYVPLTCSGGWYVTALVGVSTVWAWLFIIAFPIFTFVGLVLAGEGGQAIAQSLACCSFAFILCLLPSAARWRLFVMSFILSGVLLFPLMMSVIALPIVAANSPEYLKYAVLLPSVCRQYLAFTGFGFIKVVWSYTRQDAPRELFSIAICMLVIASESVQLIFQLKAQTATQAARMIASGVLMDTVGRMSFGKAFVTAVRCGEQEAPDWEHDLWLRTRIVYSHIPEVMSVFSMGIEAAFGVPWASTSWKWLLLICSIFAELGTDAIVCIWQWYLHKRRYGTLETFRGILERLYRTNGHYAIGTGAKFPALPQPALGGDVELPKFEGIEGSIMATTYLAVFAAEVYMSLHIALGVIPFDQELNLTP